MSNLRERSPRDLGRGLMRGERRTLKLGYTSGNATDAVRRTHNLSESEAAILEAYLQGFSDGMRRRPEDPEALGHHGACAAAYQQGVADGLREPVSHTYPDNPEHGSAT